MAGHGRAGARSSAEQEDADALVIHTRRIVDLATSDPRDAEPAARSALEAAQHAGHPTAVALALRALAAVHRARLEHAEAERLLDRAVAVSRRAALPGLEAEVRGARAAVRLEQGRVSAARNDVSLALKALGRAAPGTIPAALGAYLELQLAVLDHNVGRLREAESRYRRIAADPHRSPDVAVRVANNLAMVLAARGAFEEALASSDEAVRIAAGLGRVTLAVARQTHAWITVHEGRLTEGMAEFEEVAATYARAGLPLGEYHVEVADAMADLRLLPEAVRAAQAAVDELTSAGVWLMAVEAQVRLARLHLESGDAERAHLLATEVVRRSGAQHRAAWRHRARVVDVQARLALGRVVVADVPAVRRAAVGLERAGDLTAAAEAYLVTGRAALSVGRSAAGRDALARAGRLADRGPLLLRVRGRLARATAARAAGDGPRTVRQARAGLRDLAAHRGTLPTMELRALASGHGAELGQIGLAALLREGSPARVLRWMEQTRAAALLARLPVEPADEHAGPSEGWAALRATAATRGAAVPAGTDRDRPGHLGAAPGDATADWREPPGLTALRQALDGRVLVEVGRCEGRYVAVVVGRRRARVVELAPADAVAEAQRALVFALRRLADPRSPASAAAARTSAELRLRTLRALLLDPLGLAADDELVVVPVGPLHGVPWAALHDAPVALSPAATAWVATTARTTPANGAGTVLVAGPGLTAAQEEVESLAAVHPAARVVGAAESRTADVVRALAAADLAHLACHGVPRADNPMFSSLVLADGPVTVQQLHRAGAAPRRLVLASCHSGADVAYAGDEVLGFVSAMLARGTAGVVASIAAVPDVEVVDLMLGLHRRLAGGATMAHALHAARAEADRDTPAGFVNWCTFGAHGAA
ncbi:CHAT domain-containing protein [Cellulomonas sp.]|uniref:CHAT domain-containing protein n=1 Tax=Cellulomonas sp. TaxID=40001 RepID=UPI0028112861|nr:CHAT domain-containing protein [Cellulomonas sp.]